MERGVIVLLQVFSFCLFCFVLLVFPYFFFHGVGMCVD